MGIREALNENPRVATGLAAGLIALTLIWVVYYFWPSSGPRSMDEFKQFYSDDDGANYFKDSLTKIPPFKHDGRDAVVAHVFKGAKGKPFVGFLEKYTDQGRDKKAEIMADKAHPQRLRSELYPLEQSQKLVKKPGAGNPWVSTLDAAAAAKIKQVTSPDGSPATEISVDN
ncbi:MAG: hypothetical protein ACHRHE_03050 [Tepidisphaerales bacterium]